MSTYATLNIVNRSARAARLGQWTVVRVVGRDDEMQCGGRLARVASMVAPSTCSLLS
jgi:hypothetical protein